MGVPARYVAFVSLLAVLCAPAFTADAAQYMLVHGLLNPGTNSLPSGGQGHSVAVDGAYAVSGAPFDSVVGTNSGQARAYDTTTGTFLYSLNNPTPAPGDLFSWSVGISGKRVVVGAPNDNTGASHAGSAYVYDLTSATPMVPAATLTNPSPAALDNFGYAVAISGPRIVVGAWQKDTGATNAGSVYVYDLSGLTPGIPTVILTNPYPAVDDNFGFSVAISGTRIVAGAIFSDVGAIDTGIAHVFDLASPTPTLPVLTLTNPYPATFDNFGWSVAIAGTLVIVGVPFDNVGATDAGAAYVYDLAGTTPTLPVFSLSNPSPAGSDFFGSSVAVSGSRVVIGSYDDDALAGNAGSAYVYDLASSTPSVPIFTLTNPSAGVEDRFGCSVAISGTTVLVGADGDDNATSDTGSTHLYRLDAVHPTEPVATFSQPSQKPSDFFGVSAAVSGTRIVVGAYLEDTGANDAGSAYVYDLASTNSRVPVLRIANPSPKAGDQFGYSCAISDSLVVIGAHQADTGAGRAYLFDLASGTPSIPLLTLTNPSPASNDYFGYSVAIAGRSIAIGAYLDDTGAANAGSVYVYALDSVTPRLPVLTLTNPSPALGDFFGSAVAMSGSRIVIGASRDSAGASAAGSAYVYDLAQPTPGLPVATLTNPSPAASDQFGFSVAISGARVVIGANLVDSQSAGNVGRAYVYDLSSATPNLPSLTLTNPSSSAGDQFGYSVAISGDRVLVGAIMEDYGASNAGGAYIYDLADPTRALPVATLVNPNPGVADAFGNTVAVDGDILLVGAAADDTVSSDSGAVYVFSPTPVLTIAPLQTGFARISWTPSSLTGLPFHLQYRDELASSNWSNAPSGSLNPISIAITTNAMRFYQLSKP